MTEAHNVPVEDDFAVGDPTLTVGGALAAIGHHAFLVIPLDGDEYAVVRRADLARAWVANWAATVLEVEGLAARARVAPRSHAEDPAVLVEAWESDAGVVVLVDDEQVHGLVRAGGDGTAGTDDELLFEVGEEGAAGEEAPAVEEEGDAEPAPPRRSYARLESPGTVVAGVPFDLDVGLSPVPTAGVVGDVELEVPSWVTGDYRLTAHVVAEGFRLEPGARWRLTMPVTGAHPYPSIRIGLTALPHPDPIVARTIQATYSIDGTVIGLAVRPIAVVATADLKAEAPDPPPPPATDVALPTEPCPPDLTVNLLRSDVPHRLLMTLESPHFGDGFEPPARHATIDIGEDPARYARQLVDYVNVREGRKGIYLALRGRGRQLARRLPERFWAALRAVAKRAGRPPTLLICSADPYVPWELAVVDPPLDPVLPPFLAAQARVGRWILRHGLDDPGAPRPAPEHRLDVREVAAVAGDYGKHPSWETLKEALAEREHLVNTYAAAEVDATFDEVVAALEGTPGCQVLHVAVHGKYDPNSTEEGLMLTDREILDPEMIEGADFAAPKFVFLNACQVGSGEQILGDYSGMAAAFLNAGAVGVIAPLWNVKDGVAREIAERFYAHVFTGETVGEALRRERESFVRAKNPVSATLLGYQYFGHPELALRRE